MPTARHERIRVAKSFEGQGRTHQEFKEECDIRTIVRRWERSGVAPMLNRQQPLFGDFTMATDLKTAMDQVAEAEAQFQALPSRVRDLVDNDPVALVELVQAGGSDELLEALGLKLVDTPDELPAESKPPEPPTEGE